MLLLQVQMCHVVTTSLVILMEFSRFIFFTHLYCYNLKKEKCQQLNTQFEPEEFDHEGMYYAVVVHSEKFKNFKRKRVARKASIALRRDSRKRDRGEGEKCSFATKVHGGI